MNEWELLKKELEQKINRNWNLIQNNAQVLIAEDRDRIEKLEHNIKNFKEYQELLQDTNAKDIGLIPYIKKELAELKEVLQDYFKKFKARTHVDAELHSQLNSYIIKLGGDSNYTDTQPSKGTWKWINLNEHMENIVQEIKKGGEQSVDVAMRGASEKNKGSSLTDSKPPIAGSARQTGKTIICPNCMRQFKFNHPDLIIVSREDLEKPCNECPNNPFDSPACNVFLEGCIHYPLRKKYLGAEKQ